MKLEIFLKEKQNRDSRNKRSLILTSFPPLIKFSKHYPPRKASWPSRISGKFLFEIFKKHTIPCYREEDRHTAGGAGGGGERISATRPLKRQAVGGHCQLMEICCEIDTEDSGPQGLVSSQPA